MRIITYSSLVGLRVRRGVVADARTHGWITRGLGGNADSAETAVHRRIRRRVFDDVLAADIVRHQMRDGIHFIHILGEERLSPGGLGQVVERAPGTGSLLS